MDWEKRIVLDPEIIAGQPVVKGTRLAVNFIIGLLAHGWTGSEILDSYPGLTHEDILACLAYANEVLDSQKVYPVGAG